jgi:predicted PurR-regulated permease PerM
MTERPFRIARDAAFLRKLLTVLAVAGLALLIVRLMDVLLLAFGSVLVAVLLHAVARPLGDRLHLRRDVALASAMLLVAGAVTAGLWMFGRELEAQLVGLSARLPAAWAELRAWLATTPLGEIALRDLEAAETSGGVVLRWASRLASTALTGLTMGLIVTFAGVYLAFRPEAYLRGLLLLAPPRARPRAKAVLGACGFALNQWLLGQLISMLLVGFTTAVGLWIAGVPSPVALGLLAGLGQFVPVVGPVVSAIPGLIIALAEGPQTLVWACLIYVGVVQLESNLFTPFVLREMAQLPMALTLFAVLALGALLGPLGVLFATPLALALYVVVKMVYVEDLLGERLGEPPRVPPPAEAEDQPA